MKISSINNYSQNYHSPNFKEGKVHWISDFDLTYLPSSQKDFKFNTDKEYVDMMNTYFTNMSSFLNKLKKGLKFTISTGRTFGEFQTMAETAKERGFKMPLPDTLIVGEGSDEHFRTGGDLDFYNDGIFPFSYEVTNKQKDKTLKEKTGWDGDLIKNKIKEICAEQGLRIVEGDSAYTADFFGERSLFRQNGFLSGEQPNVGLLNYGKSKIFATFSECNQTYQQIIAQINLFLDKMGIDRIVSSAMQDNKCAGRPYILWTPAINKKWYNTGEALSKVYDTKVVVRNASKTNDLIIVSGDGPVDINMLNPLMYLEKLNPLQESFRKDPARMIEEMNKNPKLAKQFKNMPFVGIIVKSNNMCKELEELIEYFSDGPYKKLVVVEQGQIEQGITDAVRLYCKQNSHYKKKLSPDIEKTVFHNKKSPIAEENPLKKIPPRFRIVFKPVIK